MKTYKQIYCISTAVDDSEDNKVDTFFSYRSVSVLDGKKLGLDKSMRGVSLEECMEEARDRLVSALKYGNLLMIGKSISLYLYIIITGGGRIR